MNRFAALITATMLFTAACRSTAHKAGVANCLDALFTTWHDEGRFDGAVVVGHDHDVVWAKGFGYANVERQTLFTPDTPSDGASLAKTFTSALIHMAQRDGVLSLDDTAQKFLPELPYPDITLRHLLSHSSGLAMDYDYFDPFIPATQVRTTDSLLAVIAAQKPALAFKPGSAFEYSSFGYDLAALAVARATGTSYAALLDERIFRPLKIEGAFVRPGRFTDFPGVRTMGYRRIDGKLQVNDVFDMEGFHGGSNIYISARDLHRWNASFFDRTDLDATLELARIAGNPSGLTLGSWYRSADGSAFWYSGHLQGFHSEVFRDVRTKWSIVYISSNTIEPWMQKAVVRAVNAIIDGRDPQRDTTAAEKGSLAGRWIMSDGEVVLIENRGKRPYMIRDGVGYPIFPVGDAFYAPGLDFIIRLTHGQIAVSSNLEERSGRRD